MCEVYNTKKMTIMNPFAIAQFTLIQINLQHVLLYHNEERLVAIIVHHKKKIYIHEKIAKTTESEIDEVVMPAVEGGSCAFNGYGIERVDLYTMEYHVQLAATKLHDDLSSNQSHI